MSKDQTNTFGNLFKYYWNKTNRNHLQCRYCFDISILIPSNNKYKNTWIILSSNKWNSYLGIQYNPNNILVPRRKTN